MEKGSLWTTDWGEAPLIGMGTGMDPLDQQSRSYGLAMFAAVERKGGIDYDKKLYLIVGFDSLRMWTRWGHMITKSSGYGWPSVEEFMVPGN